MSHLLRHCELTGGFLNIISRNLCGTGLMITDSREMVFVGGSYRNIYNFLLQMWLAEESGIQLIMHMTPALPHPTHYLSWATIGRTHNNCSAEVPHE